MPAAVYRPFALRRDTAANWTATNPELLEGQEGYETDTRKRKVGRKDGNGVLLRWNALEYDSAEAGLTTVTVADITDFETAIQAKLDELAGLLTQDIEQATRGDVTYEYNEALTGVRYDLAEGQFDNGTGGRLYKGGPAGAPQSQPGWTPRKGDWHLVTA